MQKFWSCTLLAIVFFLFPDIRDGYTEDVAEAKYFTVEVVDGRWWILDPDGKRFISLGVDHVNYQADNAPRLGYSPYNRSVMAKYGSEAVWAQASIDRLRSWNFNTIGAWSSPSTFDKGIVYTMLLDMGSSAVRSAWLSGSFPDVFSERFQNIADALAEQYCKPRSADKWLLGYFTDNELRWAADWRSKKTLFDDFLAMPMDAPGKQKLVDLLRRKYGSDITKLNQAWGANFAEFDDLFQVSELKDAEYSVPHSDRSDFLRLVAHQYFKTTGQAIRRYDSNHLILGCRFAGDAPDEVLEEMGTFVDVVSYNSYEPAPLADILDKIYRLTHKPIMITEFSFRAKDSGLPNTRGAGLLLETQQDRANAYESFVTATLSLPYMIGLHWFKYADQPAEGRFDGENSNFGTVNIRDEPYRVLIERMESVNGDAIKIASAAKL